MAKLNKFFGIVLIILIVCTIYFVYKDYNSLDNRYKRLEQKYNSLLLEKPKIVVINNTPSCDYEEYEQNLLKKDNQFIEFQSSCLSLVHDTQKLYNETYNQYLLAESVCFEQSLFNQIAYSIASSHKYEANIYDCTQYSQDAVKMYKKYGWDAEKIRVATNCNSDLFKDTSCKEFSGRHDIVRIDKVYLEVTQGNINAGKIISPSQYKAYGITP